MTENEAIKEIETSLELAEMCKLNREREKEIKAYKMAIQALEKVQQFESIGTIEEFETLKEKSVAKKMSIGNDNGKSRKCCGNCRCFVLPASSYCSKCGQKLDWNE